MSSPRIDKFADNMNSTMAFNRLRYGDTPGFQRPINQLLHTPLDQMLQALSQAYPAQPSPAPERLSLMARMTNAFQTTVLSPFIQTLTLLMETARATAALLQGLAQTAGSLLQAAIRPAAHLLSMVGTFFLGFKKDRLDEATRRGHDDFPHSDLFTRRPVEASMGSGGHGGGGDQR